MYFSNLNCYHYGFVHKKEIRTNEVCALFVHLFYALRRNDDVRFNY